MLHSQLKPDQVKQIVQILTDNNASFVEQGLNAVAISTSSLFGLAQKVGGPKEEVVSLEEARRQVAVWGKVIYDDDTANYHINHKSPESYCFCNADITREQIKKQLPSGVKILPPSFMENEPTSGEIILENISKMTGINTIAKHLGVANANIYAFGDGDNDIEMLSGAGHGIAMQNGSQACKAAAEFITGDQYSVAIYNALAHYKIF